MAWILLFTGKGVSFTENYVQCYSKEFDGITKDNSPVAFLSCISDVCENQALSANLIVI